jgi:hypothetical protein
MCGLLVARDPGGCATPRIHPSPKEDAIEHTHPSLARSAKPELGLGVSRTGRIGTVVELADQLHRTVQRMEPTVPVIADVHPPSTDGTVPVKDVEFAQREVGVLRPSVSHPAYLRDHEPSFDSQDLP